MIGSKLPSDSSDFASFKNFDIIIKYRSKLSIFSFKFIAVVYSLLKLSQIIPYFWRKMYRGPRTMMGRNSIKHHFGLFNIPISSSPLGVCIFFYKIIESFG